MKELNRQIISVVNFVITVGGAFAFGYKGTEYAFSGPNVFAFVSITSRRNSIAPDKAFFFFDETLLIYS